MKKPIDKEPAARTAPRAKATAATRRSPRRRASSNAALVHELKVHQIELEMQNEELRHAQLDLMAARDRLADLYDFAPVGYFTLDSKGMVTEANLTGAAMLGTARKAMIGRGFARFVVPAHVTLWHRQLRIAMQQHNSMRVELALQQPAGKSFHGQLDCALVAPPGQPAALRVTLTDITQSRIAEMERRIADSAQAASEAERRHVARELHEGLGQRLSALKMELASLPLQDASCAIHARVAMMIDTLDEALASVRRIAIELRPLMLDDLGLGAAVEWLAHDVARRLGIDIRLDLHDPKPEPEERTAIAMYRMAQDMLEFIAQRGTAVAATISLAQSDGDVVLTVGCRHAPRFDTPVDETSGEPRQRLMDSAHWRGGHLELRDSAAHATSIVARMPMVRGDAARQGPNTALASGPAERRQPDPARHKVHR